MIRRAERRPSTEARPNITCTVHKRAVFRRSYKLHLASRKISVHARFLYLSVCLARYTSNRAPRGKSRRSWNSSLPCCFPWSLGGSEPGKSQHARTEVRRGHLVKRGGGGKGEICSPRQTPSPRRIQSLPETLTLRNVVPIR